MTVNNMEIVKPMLWALVALLSSCATPFDSGGEPGQMLVPVNHTHRYAHNIFVEDAWAGNALSLNVNFTPQRPSGSL